MFPSSPSFPSDDPHDPLLSYYPYADGYDDGFDEEAEEPKKYMASLETFGPVSLSRLANSLADTGRPVTCIIYSHFASWATDVARDLSVPSVFLWNQSASIFAIYYHYFHTHRHYIDDHRSDPSFVLDLPGLPPLQIRDLPSFFAHGNPFAFVLNVYEKMFKALDGSTKATVLINTFDALEKDAISSVGGGNIDVYAIGPLVPSALVGGKDPKDTAFGGDLVKTSGSAEYMKWLDSKHDKSVVYVSFGSISVLPKKQLEEISQALAGTGRPYLWVARGGREGVDVGDEGLVVDWCSQVEVLSHSAIGCFLTHCGWNSTVEAVVCGVPAVGFPQWTDQWTNGKMVEMEEAWGMGVRCERNGEGVVEGRELRRCLDLVMGEEEEQGVAKRKRAEMWKEKATEAWKVGGSSVVNFKVFIAKLEESP